jgi:hypothetical protein
MSKLPMVAKDDKSVAAKLKKAQKKKVSAIRPTLTTFTDTIQ